MKESIKNCELKIELITCESGDYEVLKVNDEVYYSGHSIPSNVWMDVFRLNGNKTLTTSISDEEMENY